MTRLEAVLAALEVLLSGVQGVDEDGVPCDCRVEIDRVTPFTRAEAPAINLTFDTEEAAPYGGPDWRGHEIVQPRARLEVALYTRGSRPVVLCERLFETVHARVMADPTLGGLLHKVRYAGRRWQSEDADGPAGWVIASYDLIYTASERLLA